MSIFKSKSAKAPLKTITSDKECKRTYKYVSHCTPYKNLGGYDYPGEWGFAVVHELGGPSLRIRTLEGNMWSDRESISLTSRETIAALIETLQACLAEDGNQA
jgi:hypothetical protein